MKERFRFDLANEWRNLALLSVTFSTALYRISLTVADPDLWGHLRFGGDIWHSGKVIQLDPYSYLTKGQLWINHEWLSELIFFVVYSCLGLTGLVGLKVGICLVLLAVMYQCLLDSGLSRVRACILTIWVAVLLAPGVSSIRPQLFTYGLFLMLLLVLKRQEQAFTAWFWTIPLIFAAWINLHGGFLAGLAVLLLWFSVRLLGTVLGEGGARPLKQQLGGSVTILLTSLALLLNPYGWRLLQFLLRPETFIRPEVTEWGFPSMMSTYGGFLVALCVFAGVSVWLSHCRRNAASIAVLVAVVLAGLTAFRHGPLLALTIPVLAGTHIGDVWNRWMPPRPQKETRFKSGIIVIWSLAYASIMVAGSIPHFGCIRLEPLMTGGYPVDAVRLLKSSGASGNLVVFFNWGEYALWHLSPRIKVSVDGRRETVYSDMVYQENLAFAEGRDGWDRILDKYDTDLALVNRNYPVFSLMQQQPEWIAVYQDDLCGLFVRKEHASLKQLIALRSQAAPIDSQNRCFP